MRKAVKIVEELAKHGPVWGWLISGDLGVFMNTGL